MDHPDRGCRSAAHAHHRPHHDRRDQVLRRSYGRRTDRGSHGALLRDLFLDDGQQPHVDDRDPVHRRCPVRCDHGCRGFHPRQPELCEVGVLQRSRVLDLEGPHLEVVHQPGREGRFVWF